jgi:hypothetical protein
MGATVHRILYLHIQGIIGLGLLCVQQLNGQGDLAFVLNEQHLQRQITPQKAIKHRRLTPMTVSECTKSLFQKSSS